MIDNLKIGDLVIYNIHGLNFRCGLGIVVDISEIMLCRRLYHCKVYWSKRKEITHEYTSILERTK